MAKRRLDLGPAVRGLLQSLDAFFSRPKVEAYVVGGCLRDALMGRETRDVDLTVVADPLALGRDLAGELGGSFFPLAEERSMARVLLPTGLQVDLLPLDGDIEADLRRRDFTIDAIAAPLGEAAAGLVEVIDPCGGQQDLERRLVRAVSEEAFRQDPLRPLRGTRLAVELGFEVEPGTAGLIAQYAPQLPQAAAERRRDELMRILAASRAAPGLCLLDDLGLLAHLLPEVTDTRGVEQPKEHHWDVFGHSIGTVAALDALLSDTEPPEEPWQTLWAELWGQLDALKGEVRPYLEEEVVPGHSRQAILKLGGLLHDIAKPETKAFDKNGRMRFFGHPEQGARKAARILRRLRFASREVQMVGAMAAAHLRPVQLGQQGPPTRRALYRFFRDCGDAAIAVLLLSLADHLATVGPNLNREGWRAHVSLVNYILTERYREETIVAPPKLISGEDLMADLGLPPGPAVGELLEAVREAQAAGEVTTREEALSLAKAKLENLNTAGAKEAG